MKRHTALQEISREHQHALTLAQQIIRAVKASDNQQLRFLATKAVDYYQQELEEHFRQEEDTVFRILADECVQHQALTDSYLQEHETLRQQIADLDEELPADTLCEQMEAFALLLKSHTRREERELFPLIEESFTNKQLRQITRMNQS